MLGLEKTELHSAFGSVTELHLDDTLLAWEEVGSKSPLVAQQSTANHLRSPH